MWDTYYSRKDNQCSSAQKRKGGINRETLPLNSNRVHFITSNRIAAPRQEMLDLNILSPQFY